MKLNFQFRCNSGCFSKLSAFHLAFTWQSFVRKLIRWERERERQRVANRGQLLSEQTQRTGKSGAAGKFKHRLWWAHCVLKWKYFLRGKQRNEKRMCVIWQASFVCSIDCQGDKSNACRMLFKSRNKDSSFCQTKYTQRHKHTHLYTLHIYMYSPNSVIVVIIVI